MDESKIDARIECRSESPTSLDYWLTFLPVPYIGEVSAYKTLSHDLEGDLLEKFNPGLHMDEESFKQSVINKRVLLVRGMSYLSLTVLEPMYEAIKYFLY